MVSSPNWAQRYSAGQPRHCARPGCGAPATATLRFEPTHRAAWLVDLDDAGARAHGDLCARHAATLVMPRGWELHDQRVEVLDGSVPAVPPLRRPILRARRTDLAAVPAPESDLDTDVDPEPDVDPDPEPETASAAEHEVEPQAAEPAEPHVVGEPLADVLDAQTPLLRRAFSNLRPPDEDS